MSTPFRPYDEATSKSTVAALCALLDLFDVPGEDAVLEWEARVVLYELSEAERETIRIFAQRTRKAIGRYLSEHEVATMFATKPKHIRRMARSGELPAAMRQGKLYFTPEAINAYVDTHCFAGSTRKPPEKPAL